MKILITAGPTHEAIDPVRYITNRSSGKMGYALATAAHQKGHQVCLISGPVALPTPPQISKFIQIISAKQMANAVFSEAEQADLIIMAAAVADYCPVYQSDQKIKKKKSTLTLELEPTQDILAELGRRKKEGQILVGFAAETNHIEQYALEKIKKKNIDWIIANDVSQKDRGFEVDQNAVTLYSRCGQKKEIELMSKNELSFKILEIILSPLCHPFSSNQSD